jgi:hypothetical protein
LVDLGAFRGGAAGRLVTVLVKPGVGFALTSFSGSLEESSSAFRFEPCSGEGAAGNPGRVPALLSNVVRCALAVTGLAGGFGGAGALPLPMELTMSPRKLILEGAECKEKGLDDG